MKQFLLYNTDKIMKKKNQTENRWQNKIEEKLSKKIKKRKQFEINYKESFNKL